MKQVLYYRVNIRLAYRRKLKVHARMFVASSKHNPRKKTDMIEANTTYLWQTRHSVDTKILCASAPVSLFRMKDERCFVGADAASGKRRHLSTGASTICRRMAHTSDCNSSFLPQTASIFLPQERFVTPRISSANKLETYHADMDASASVSAFSFSGNTFRPPFQRSLKLAAAICVSK